MSPASRRAPSPWGSVPGGGGEGLGGVVEDDQTVGMGPGAVSCEGKGSERGRSRWRRLIGEILFSHCKDFLIFFL